MESGIQSQAPFREKVIKELSEFAILTVYLYVCFAALLYLKAAVLETQGITYAHWGFAIIKAMLCAKFMLMGRMVNLGDRFKKYPLVVPTLYRSIVFLVFLIALTIIEEAVVGVIHGRTILNSISDIAGGTFHQMIAASLIMFLILIPYFAFRSLGDVISDRTLVRLYFERRRSIDHP
jgi:hypothetical protein